MINKNTYQLLIQILDVLLIIIGIIMNGIPKIDHPTISNKDITVMINLIVYLLSMSKVHVRELFL